MNTKIIIASDIFGRTQELEEIASQLSTGASHVTLIDPYEGLNHDFKNEDEAYSLFQREIGIERYMEKVYRAAADISSSLFLVGFSIGASAIWAISDKLTVHKGARAICFYGSQIRFYTEIMPAISMELIFPAHEPHFNLDQLIAQITLKHNVEWSKETKLHGFMNKRSVNFDRPAYERYLNYLKERLALVASF